MFTAIMRAFFSPPEIPNPIPAIGTCLLTSDLPTLLVVLLCRILPHNCRALPCPIPYLPRV